MIDENSTSQNLPLRDFFLLPLLSLATVVAMFGASEIVARRIFVGGGKDPCWVRYDPRIGGMNRPNCTAKIKVYESPWVEQTFNECGYRTPESCGPKRPGTIRVALMGGSVAEGYLIPYKNTFAAQASQQLSAQCRRKVEFQNLAVEGCSLLFVCRRTNEALNLRPDVVLWILSPFDLEQDIDSGLLSRRDDLEPIPEEAAPAFHLSLFRRLQAALTDSRIVFAAQHSVFQNQALYVKLYLMQADRVGFMKKPLTPKWLKRLANFEVLLADMADKTRRAGVPLVIAVAPQRAQAALSSMTIRPPNIDPYLLESKIAEIASRHQVAAISTLSGFGSLPHPEALYYPVDGHLSGEGQTVLANAIVPGLLKGICALSNCASPGERNMAHLN